MQQPNTWWSFARTASLLAVAVAGSSVTVVQPASAEPLPSYARGEETIRGRVQSFDGAYRLAVRDDRGFTDNVRLHDGTVINPTGLRLAPGQSVTIVGHADGKAFEANEIDTPYARYPQAPYAYGYPYSYRDGYGYGYGYAPYPIAYPYPVYGPRFGFGFRTRGFAFGGRF